MNGTTTMNALIDDIVTGLDEIAGLDALWPRGAVHRGGPHYRLRGTVGPVSIGMDECRVFGKLIQETRPARCFIIGNAFGLSSVFIAKMMEQCGGQHVVTLDNQSEGDGQRNAAIAQSLTERLECRLLSNRKGESPRDIPRVAGERPYDMILIDGLHRHPQVTRDFLGVREIATDDAVFCWHDYWMLGIPQSVAEAQRCGFHCVKVNSSCEIVLGTRNESVYHRIEALYDNTEPPRKRLRPTAFLKACHAMATGTLSTWRARTRQAR